MLHMDFMLLYFVFTGTFLWLWFCTSSHAHHVAKLVDLISTGLVPIVDLTSIVSMSDLIISYLIVLVIGTLSDSYHSTLLPHRKKEKNYNDMEVLVLLFFQIYLRSRS